MSINALQLTPYSVRSFLAPASSARGSATFSAEKKGGVLIVIKTCLTKRPFYETPVLSNAPICQKLYGMNEIHCIINPILKNRMR